jgi:Tol biopolymer transport system component
VIEIARRRATRFPVRATALLAVLGLIAGGCSGGNHAATATIRSRRIGVIVFVSTRDGVTAIYRMAPDGSHQMRLTVGSEQVAFPALSPDGTLVSYISFPSHRVRTTKYGSRDASLWIMHADGTDPRRLVGGLTRDSTTAWSPDGRSMAVSKDGGISVVDVTSGRLRPVLAAGQYTADPTWTPSGRDVTLSAPINDLGNYVLQRVAARLGSTPFPIVANGQSLFQPRYSPNGRELAFWALDNRHLYVSSPTGSDTHVVVNRPVSDWYSWDPDGSAFLVSMPGAGLVRYPLKGSPSKPLSDPGDQQPDWRSVPAAAATLPTPRSVAFVSNRDGNLEVYAMNADGSDQTRITNHGESEFDPVFSPDGRRLAFVRLTRPGGTDVHSSLVVSSADGSRARSLTTIAGAIAAIGWSPDGRRLTYEVVTKTDQSVWTVGASGGNAKLLADHAAYPRWSPTGKHVAYVSAGSPGTQGAGSTTPAAYSAAATAAEEIRIADPVTGRSSAFAHARSIGTIEWAPDDRSIVNSGTSRQGGRALYVVTLDTDQVRQITSGRYTDVDPQWSPDSSRVAFVRLSVAGGTLSPRAELCIVPAGGGPVRVVTHFGISTKLPGLNIGWAPDSSWIGFVDQTAGRSAVERVDLATGAVTDLTRSYSDNFSPSWQGPAPGG